MESFMRCLFSPGINIFSLQGGLDGSVLTYHCSPAQYPYPVSYRLCSAGQWSTMSLANGRQVSKATCKGNALLVVRDAFNVIQFHPIPPLILPHLLPISPPLPDVLCPAQLQLDHGDIWPRVQWSRVGETQNFFCQDGFTLYGSAQRNCTFSGTWTGSTPICDNHGKDRHQRSYVVIEFWTNS